MERKPFFPKHAVGNSRPETFAIRVEGYDLKANPNVVKGVRLDNNEPVSVSLRSDIKYNQRGRFKRSEIADFAAPRKTLNHPGTAPGGILLAQEAFSQKDGSWGARWIQSLSHAAGEAEVFQAVVHVTPVKYTAKRTPEFPNGRPWSQMTVLHDGDFSQLSEEMANALKLTPPFPVDSAAELREAVTHLLNDGVGVGVRVSNTEGYDAMYVSKRRDDEVDVSVENFMKEISQLEEPINKGELLCEVIPYGNVWAGPATTEIMEKNAVIQARLKQFNRESEGRDGRIYPVPVYRPAIVAVRLTAPGEDGERAVFFSHFEPLWTREPVNGLVTALCYAKTDALAPEPPRVVAPNANGAAPASTGELTPEGDGTGSFDMEHDDVDLMDAAGMHGDPMGGGDLLGDDIPAMGGAEPPRGEPAAAQPGEEAAAQPQAAPPARGRYAGRRVAA